MGHLLTWEVHLSVSYLIAFSYCSLGFQDKNTEVVCHSILHVLSELCTMTHLSWVTLHSRALSFIEWDRALGHVIRLVSFLWLWFSALWWRRIRSLWKLPDGRDWRPVFSKSLIQFSVYGWGCIPSLLFTWGQTLVEVMKIIATSFQRSHACTAILSAPTLLQDTADPCLCWRLLNTHGQVWVSLLWGHCSFLLGPGSVCALQNSASPVEVLAALWWG